MIIFTLIFFEFFLVFLILDYLIDLHIKIKEILINCFEFILIKFLYLWYPWDVHRLFS